MDYADNVSEEERVPGLCGAIEDVYHAVCDFAREQLGERCELGEIPQIRVILKKECPTRTYRNDSEYIAKKLNEIAQQGRQITAKDVENASRITTRTRGVFYHKNTDPYIVIYYRQFKVDNWCEYIAGIANTLAHEYAHYLEYLCCSRCSTEPFEDSCVSEAMADFFGVLFSINRGGACDLAVAQNEYDEWVEHFGSSWPYAEALRFYTVGGNELSPFSNNYADYETHGSIEKFVCAFKNCPEPAKAYKIMINA